MISFFKIALVGEKKFRPHAYHQVTHSLYAVKVSSEFTEYRRFRGIFRRPEVYFGYVKLTGEFKNQDRFESVLKTKTDVADVLNKLEDWNCAISSANASGNSNDALKDIRDGLLKTVMHHVADKVYA